jgi:antitoxin (DNA-binding transcriptional repressor) of toxin-antitoxin stability system
MQTAKSGSQEPAARTIGVHELKDAADEIVREVNETGRPIDIALGGKIVARLSPRLPEEPDTTDTASARDREEAVRDWHRKMDEVSREIALVWPKGVSAQDVIDDVRGPLPAGDPNDDGRAPHV